MRKATLACLAVAICASLALPSIATAQDFPPASRFQKVTLNDRPGEPMSLAVLPDGRVLHSARTGEIRIHNPRTGPQHPGGRHAGEPRGPLPARRGGRPGHRARPEVPEQPLGLRLLLAAARHPGRRPRHRRRRQRGRRAVPRSRPPRTARGSRSSTGTCCSRASSWSGASSTSTPSSRSSTCRSTAASAATSAARSTSTARATSTCRRATTRTRSSRAATRRSTSGDTRNPAFDAQRTSANTNDLRGKILRIRVTAGGGYSIPAGNLFRPGTAKTRPEIYAMGFRNPFRMRSTRSPTTSTSATTRRTPTRPIRRAGPPAYGRWMLVRPARQLWLAVLHDPQPRLHRLRLRDRGRRATSSTA